MSSHFTLKDPKHGILSRMPDASKPWPELASLATTRRKELGKRTAAVTGQSVTRAALMATIEQLSAANEELETANEELQASYQEISALGTELRNRNTR